MKKSAKKPLAGFNLPALSGAAKPSKQRLVTPPVSSPLRRDTRGERFVVYLPDELGVEFRVKCAELRYSKSFAMSEAVDEWIAKRSKRPDYVQARKKAKEPKA
jgi:hypothetical protein